MILDVGCGDEPKGDINVDLFIKTCHLPAGVYLRNKDVTKTKADIVADGNYLPFRADTFDKVISYHVIEHTKTPFKFIKELVRVSKDEIEVKCPHKLSGTAKAPYHFHTLIRPGLIRRVSY
ncbi:methyltransferase domain-containing protein [Candidatus Borrarchaeum sp.]|uniref:methyltransferase domain-containing protein n=1 Tax=Candidatus Borrarchaeum sp. TaxID=2846742 RepID=UPI00257B20A3|nr:methyltransferase domain-containing protein [Candidatus Borrarchaeum sp.]